MLIAGTLITGNRATGKTTLVEGLVRALGRTKAIGNKYDLQASPLMIQALRLISEGNESYEANRLLIAAYRNDALHPPPTKKHILQDSYWERTAAYCETYGMEDLSRQILDGTDRLCVFEKTIVLEAEYDVRVQRILKRGGRGLEEMADRGRDAAMDAAIARIARTLPRTTFIDTTALTPSETVAAALRSIRA